MRPDESVERQIRELQARTTASADRRILAEAIDVLEQAAIYPPQAGTAGTFWRKTIMKNTWTKLATAAAIFVAVGTIFVTVADRSTPVAYALEQTVQASHSVRTLHIKDYEVGKKEPKEFWMRFDDRGELQSARSIFPAWASGGDGHKEVVWKDGKAQVWFKDKNASLIVGDQRVAEMLTALVQKLDPKQVVQGLERDAKAGKVDLEIRQPGKDGDPIVVVATFKPDNVRRWIIFVDPKTKLVTKMEFHELVKDRYELKGWDEFLGYNEPIPDSVFTLELPPGTMLIDQTRQDVGLVQGGLSNDEIARQVVRELFDALIVKDYARAGKVLSGMPADAVEKTFGKLHVVRIVSIGQPEPHAETGGLRVPTVIEIEKDGKKETVSPRGPFVRQVYNQPDRWEVIGGI